MSNETENLDISVLISTRDRARLLEATLKHFERQELANLHWELIVVDNGSSDDTQSVLDRARGRLPLTILHEPEPGKNRSLNRALDVARGGLLVFTDDDVEFSEGWLNELHQTARRWPEYTIFCGPIHPSYTTAVPAWLHDHPFASAAFAAFTPRHPEGPLPPRILPFGPNFSVRASALADLRFCTKIGPKGKNYAMGGETEFLQRLVAKGERVIYNPEAQVNHIIDKHQLEIRWLLKRGFRLGRGIARMRPDLNSTRFRGVPWYLWCRIPLTFLRYMISRFQKGRARFEGGIGLYFHFGQLYEYRLLRAELDEKQQVESLLAEQPFLSE